MTTFEVVPGSEAQKLIDEMGLKLAALRAGKAKETKFFSGGSDTRRHEIEGCIANYEALGIKAIRQGGCTVIIGN